MDHTKAQLAAISEIDRNLQIIACAGSGKTRVVAERGWGALAFKRSHRASGGPRKSCPPGTRLDPLDPRPPRRMRGCLPVRPRRRARRNYDTNTPSPDPIDSLVVARSHEVHVLHRFQKRNISAVRPTPYSQSRTRPLRLREDRECRVHPNNHVIMFIDRHSSPIRGRCILECGRPAQRTVHEILKIDQVQRAPGRDVSLPSYPALRYGVQGTSADIAYLTVNLVRLSSVIVFHMTT